MGMEECQELRDEGTPDQLFFFFFKNLLYTNWSYD